MFIEREAIRRLKWHTWEEIKEGGRVGEDELPIVYRLNRMISLGYEIDHIHGQDEPTSIYLRHPNKKLTNGVFYLFGDGLLVEGGSHKGRKQLRFGPSQGKDFEDFCQTIPIPNKRPLLTIKLTLVWKIALIALHIALFFVIFFLFDSLISFFL
jgi:hypothetical protein